MSSVVKFFQEFHHADGILYVIAILFVLVEILKAVSWLAEKFGLKTKYVDHQERQDNEINGLHEELNELRTEYEASAAHCEQRDVKIMSALDEIRDSQKSNVARHDFISAMSIRRALVSGCEQAIRDKQITSNSLRSLEDLYKAYHEPEYLGQNSYVSDLMEAVKKLEIVIE